jgi:integrase
MKIDLFDGLMFSKYLRDEKGLAFSTINGYVHTINRFLDTNPDLEDSNSYNSFIVQTAIKKKNYSTYYTLKSFIEFKYKTDSVKKKELLDSILERSPAMSDHTKEYESLNDNKLIEVINNIDDEKFQTVALIQWRTGARAGDVIRTKKEDIKIDYFNNEETLLITMVAKRKKRKKIRLFRTYKDIVLNYINSTDAEYPFMLDEKNRYHRRGRSISLFESDEDKKILSFYKRERVSYNRYLNELKKALIKSNIDVTRFATHSFRKLFARYTWDTYKDITVVQRELDHADPRTTLQYLKKEGLQSIQVTHDIGTRPLNTNKDTNIVKRN